VHYEDLAFQDFEEELVLIHGSNAKTERGSDDSLELISILPMKSCLPVVAKSLLAYHNNPFSRFSKGKMLSCLLKSLLGTMANKRVVP